MSSITISIIAVTISLGSLAWNVLRDYLNRFAKLEVWQRNHFYLGGNDSRTEVNLIIRNRSSRPTAVLDIYTKDSSGGLIKNINEKYEVHMPIKIGPWDVHIVDFRLEPWHEEKLDHISIRDLDDKDITVRRGEKKRWYG